ncbi:MAG: DNA mismatch repair protein MutS [Candidatus Aminicenantes bacterium]|nr:DNA mismatch repair protein MutS [Candidatus Aminicenantes bacterium]
MAQDHSLTPMMDQYFRIKKQHQDALLLFRLGDFYEMFYEDAKLGSAVLEIALTSRQKVPMCGVPFHAVDSYIAKLLRRGFRVAICEQVEDPKSARGIVKRDVIKVLTPGTAVEVDPEESRESTFIASLAFPAEGWGLAVIDLSSGEMRTTEGPWTDIKLLADELFRTSPKEVVIPAGDEEKLNREGLKAGLGPALVSVVEDWTFEHSQARQVLLGHFGVVSLTGFDLEDKPRATAAAGGLLAYLKKVRKDSLALIHKVTFVAQRQFLTLDATTIRNLELVRNLRDGRVKDSLLYVIDFTLTPMGGRLLRSWLLRPLVDSAAINARLDAVAELFDRTIERQELRNKLKGILDLERLTGRISLSAGHPRDLVALKKSLQPLAVLGADLKVFASAALEDVARAWDDGLDLVEFIGRAVMDEPAFLLNEGGIIKDGYNPELDDLRRISHSGKAYIAGLEKRERDRTGIGSLKVRFNKVFGYFIEVTKANLAQVPSDYIRKQTLVGQERFITPELKEFEEKILHAEERIAELEFKLFVVVREKVAAQSLRLLGIAGRVAALDVLAGLGELASGRHYARPEVHTGESLVISDGRHPVIEVTNSEPFVPNDTRLDRDEDQILIITGPNMGGKSTYLRQVALIVILAQMGSFVPAGGASLGVVDRIFTRIGAMDFLSFGQSTFMVEMLETAGILYNVTPRSLVLLDEIGRGTSTFDGLSIAWAVAEFLHEQAEARPKTLFATHYHELTELALTLKRVKNHHVAVKEWKEDIVFLRKIVPGPSDQSYGIHVAKLAGIPREVISRAREILFNLERQELDEAGQPVLALPSFRSRDKSQRLLFEEDRRRELLEELWEDIARTDLSGLTPLEALNILHRLQEKLKKGN